MACCGSKRKEWLSRARNASAYDTNEDKYDLLISDKPYRVFEYTGEYSLVIRGITSRKTYYFKYKGDKLKVDYSDSFALMAERDLKLSNLEMKTYT